MVDLPIAVRVKNFPQLLVAILGCELIGILGSVFTVSSIATWYATLNKPSFAPPNWLFGPVWTLLYFLMGVSLYLVWQQGTKKKKVRAALMYFSIQLALNFIWPPIFFGLRSPALALLVIVAMWVMIVATIRRFYPLSRWAASLLVPYLLWVSFATVLNGFIVALN